MIVRKDDSFFQLSLTELAFVLVFIVLLLIGGGFVLSLADTSRCQVFLSACNERAAKCEQENNECRIAFKKRGEDPDAVIDGLINLPKLRREKELLEEENKELKEKVKAFKDLEKKIPDPVRARAAEEFLAGYEKSKKTSMTPESAREKGEEAAQLARKLADCQGQLKHCVQSTGAKARGYGHPPCWSDSNGGIQYMFGVEIRNEGLIVQKEWPSEREEDAKQIPAIQATIGAGLQSLEQFKTNTKPIFDASKSANPECRHYVIIRRAPSVRDIDLFNRLRLGVEDHFYKLDRTGIAGR